MFQQILALSRNTFVESIRQPIYVVLIVVGTIGLWLNPQLAAYTLEDDNKMMIDLGLSLLFLIGLLMAAFTATGVLTAEIENRTVLTVVSKPVARPLFVLGKFIGVAGALAVAYITLATTFLLNVRHAVLQTASDKIDWPVILFAGAAIFLAALIATLGNYLYAWVFTSTFVFVYAELNFVAYVLVLVIDKQWQFQSITAEFTANDGHLVQLLISLLLLFEAIVMLSAVAIAVSTRLGQVMTLVVCFAVFLLGLVSNSIYHRYEENFFARLFFWLMPNLQYLWQADALTAGHDIPFYHVLLVSSYSMLYVAALLCLSVSLFQTREVG